MARAVLDQQVEPSRPSSKNFSTRFPAVTVDCDVAHYVYLLPGCRLRRGTGRALRDKAGARNVLAVARAARRGSRYTVWPLGVLKCWCVVARHSLRVYVTLGARLGKIAHECSPSASKFVRLMHCEHCLAAASALAGAPRGVGREGGRAAFAETADFWAAEHGCARCGQEATLDCQASGGAALAEHDLPTSSRSTLGHGRARSRARAGTR